VGSTCARSSSASSTALLESVIIQWLNGQLIEPNPEEASVTGAVKCGQRLALLLSFHDRGGVVSRSDDVEHLDAFRSDLTASCSARSPPPASPARSSRPVRVTHAGGSLWGVIRARERQRQFVFCKDIFDTKG